MERTERTYLAASGREALQADATVIAVAAGEFACDRSCFFPGGGGQPCDVGALHCADGSVLAIGSARADEAGAIWHACAGAVPPPGTRVRLVVDSARRAALSRYHTALHVLNAIALRDHGGWITGAQIASDYARIDFKIERFSAELCADLERKANAVIAADHPISAVSVDEAEFARRGDLLRTLEVRPPVVDGQVRVVRIERFDEQACGGTHAGSTGELGRLTVTRTENKGRNNKRLYVRLDSRR